MNDSYLHASCSLCDHPLDPFMPYESCSAGSICDYCYKVIHDLLSHATGSATIGNWRITRRPDLPTVARWEFIHDDYDGPEDRFRFGTAATLEEAMAEITERQKELEKYD